MDYYSPFWGPRAISTIDDHRGAFTCPSSTVAILADSGPFCGLLLTIWGPKAISMVVETKMCLYVGRQDSQFGPILARFLVYYSLFWGPGVISTIDEPQGAFAGRSSTLIVLADSGPFPRLLLTILGSRSNFQD